MLILLPEDLHTESATVMLAFFFFSIFTQDFHLTIPFPFLWQMSLNSLAICKYISILGEDNFFVFAKNYTDPATSGRTIQFTAWMISSLM